jgi:phosphoribosylcarboxyaminoimidazole (NCAIR) mutase
MVEENEVIVAGVSGGADSVCLFFILEEYCRKRNAKLAVVHMNHGLRVEAKEDAEYVKTLCEEFGVPFHLYEKNIAEEARVIVEEGGCEAITSYDIGVAGIHRLFPQIAHMTLEGVRAFIVCAGMEGALPSVVAGLVDVPVIAVPTSVGYGVGEGGRVALDAMLQSCAPGIAVVNIDNGFGAGVFALTIVNSD